MTISRVSTMAMHHETMRDVTRTQARLAGLQNQVSSGLKSSDFKGLHGFVETFVQLDAKMRKTNQFLDGNTLLVSRLQTMDVALDQLIHIADAYQDLLMQRRNGATGHNVQFEVAARALMESAAGQLNTSQEGRYLFGGSRTEIPPVMNPIPSSITPGAPDDGYYQGNNDELKLRIQENFEITYNIRANESGFQKLFGAINLGIQASKSGSQSELANAHAMITDAIGEIIAIRAQVQQNLVNVEEINSRHEQLNLYWKGITERISRTDILSASTEIAMNEAILQASFQSFARLSQLRLSDFLR